MSNAKSKTASFLPLFGTWELNEKLTEKIENSSKTVSLHPFLNGWQQKNSGFTNFSENLFFSEISQKKSEIRHNSRKATQKV